MSKQPTPKLAKGDHVVVAWPEYASGPGWSNALVWVIVHDAKGNLRREALQPHMQDDEMRTLFAIGADCAKRLKAAALAVMSQRRAVSKDGRPFAERLRSAREHRGLTQAQVATAAGLSAAAISHFERGQREPNLANLRRLCQALSVRSDTLVGQ